MASGQEFQGSLDQLQILISKTTNEEHVKSTKPRTAWLSMHSMVEHAFGPGTWEASQVYTASSRDTA